MSGDAIKLSSGNSIEVPDDTFRLKNIEYLNTLRPNGLPRHNIIKILMLLPNTNPREGICNRNRTLFDITINNKLLFPKVHYRRDYQTSSSTEAHIQAQ